MARAAEALKSLVDCPVCMDVLTEPKQLNCGHSFCSGCLDHMIIYDSSPHVQCPVCRKRSYVPDKGFVTNFTLAHIVNQIQKNLRSSKSSDKITKVHQCHAGIICNGCEKVPIVGIRYKCFDCENYDLCGKCHDKGTHSDHFMLPIKDPNDNGWRKILSIFNPEQDQPRHVGIKCDGCNKNPIVGVRFKCVHCDHYDHCSQCERNGTHHRHHLMLRISDPNEQSWKLVTNLALSEPTESRELTTIRSQARALVLSKGAQLPHTGVKCDGCNVKPIMGARFKCFQCNRYDLCGVCEAAGAHPEHNIMMRICDPTDFDWKSLFNKYHQESKKAAPTPNQIDSVVDEMVGRLEEMGFDNDEGWITELVRRKRDINEVLNILEDAEIEVTTKL